MIANAPPNRHVHSPRKTINNYLLTTPNNKDIVRYYLIFFILFCYFVALDVARPPTWKDLTKIIFYSGVLGKSRGQARVSVCSQLDNAGHWFTWCNVSQVTLLDIESGSAMWVRSSSLSVYMPAHSLNKTQRGLVLCYAFRWFFAKPDVAQPKPGAQSISNSSLTLIPSQPRMPDGPAKKPDTRDR